MSGAPRTDYQALFTLPHNLSWKDETSTDGTAWVSCDFTERWFWLILVNWFGLILFCLSPLPHAHWHKTVVWASSFCWFFVCMSAKFVICKSLWKNSFNVNTVYSSLKKEIFLVLHDHLINSNRNQYFHNLLVTHIYARCYRFFGFSPDSCTFCLRLFI